MKHKLEMLSENGHGSIEYDYRGMIVFFNTKTGIYEIDAWFRDNKFTDVEDMKKAVDAHKKEQRYNKYYY